MDNIDRYGPSYNADSTKANMMVLLMIGIMLLLVGIAFLANEGHQLVVMPLIDLVTCGGTRRRMAAQHSNGTTTTGIELGDEGARKVSAAGKQTNEGTRKVSKQTNGTTSNPAVAPVKVSKMFNKTHATVTAADLAEELKQNGIAAITTDNIKVSANGVT